MYQSQSEWVIFHVKVLSKYSCSCLHWSLFSTNSALVLLTEGTQKKLLTYFCPGTTIQLSLWTEKTVTGYTMQRNLQCSKKIDTQKKTFAPLCSIPVICILFKLPHWNVILVIIFLVSIIRLWRPCSFPANTREYSHFPYEKHNTFPIKKKLKIAGLKMSWNMMSKYIRCPVYPRIK